MRLSFLFFGIGLLMVPNGANAQALFDPALFQDDAFSGRVIQLIALITVLSLAPGLAIMITCFPFIVTVLSILRLALGLQQSPPNMLIVSLALFLTYFVMAPTFELAYTTGIAPLVDGQLPFEEGVRLAFAPFESFMIGRTDPDTLANLVELRSADATATPSASILIPAFMLSEVERAFQIGFLLFLPFLIIDLVVAAVLMSMGMMMVPPALVSLPFKLAFFVVADGWSLVTEALVRSYF